MGDPDVDRMCAWVDDALAAGTFPMRGSHKDWRRAVATLGEQCPSLADRWTSESMRKAYERRRRRGY